VANEGASGNLKAHERSYEGFIAMFKYGAIFVAAVAIVVVLIIAH
jgi:hypothetical protein